MGRGLEAGLDGKEDDAITDKTTVFDNYKMNNSVKCL